MRYSNHRAFRGLMGALCAVLALALFAGGAARADGIAQGEIELRVQPGVDVNAVAADYGMTVLDGIPDLNIYSLSANFGEEDAFAAMLAADNRIVWAETVDELKAPEFGDRAVGPSGSPTSGPNTQYHFAFDKGHDSSGYVNSQAWSQVHIGSAWSYASGTGVIVAVLDTGASFDHPDLAGVYLPGYNVLQPGQLPWDAADGATNAAVGHGTMVAGIVHRIAPGALILPVRVINADGGATMMDVAKGLHYAVKYGGARVVTMSFGSQRLSEAMKDVIDEARAAEVVMVAAAGNDGTNQVQYPALRSGVLGVASVGADNTKSLYSDFGSAVKIVTPGTGITSTYLNGDYATASGTSFSVPFVAGEAALMLSRSPRMRAKDVNDAICGTAKSVDNVNPLYKGQLGKGLIDIEAGVKSAH